MHGGQWIVVPFGIAAVVFFWRLIQQRPPAPEEAPRAPRTGKAPHPHAVITDLPSGAMRLIDLRGIPVADLRVARLGLVQEQLLLERPISAQIWVAQVDVVREWASLTETALIILNGRFRDSRDPNGKNFIYPFGGTLTEDEAKKLGIAGVEVVVSMENLGDPPKKLEELLSTPDVWSESADDRPVPAHDVLSADPFDGKPVRIIERFAFVDLRRLTPGGWKTGVAYGRVEKLVPTLATAQIDYVVWVAAPWVLELIDDATAERIEKLADSLPAGVKQRLAVVAPAGEATASSPLEKRLRAKTTAVTERFVWRTAGGTFDVHPIQALHDAYFVAARKQPRL